MIAKKKEKVCEKMNLRHITKKRSPLHLNHNLGFY